MTITAPMCQKIWQNLIAEIPLQPSDVAAVKFSTKELAMCTAKYGVCVSIRSCPHGAVDLCGSYFDGTYIERPRHQGLYDVRDGTAKAAPARRPLWLIQTWGSDRFE